MPTLEITDATFARLQAFATPLVDTPETALCKVLDLAEAGGAAPLGAPGPLSTIAPNLAFTSLSAATIDGKALPPARRNWNGLLLSVIETAATKLPPGAALTDLLVANHVAGQKTDNGYKHLKSVGLSVQGQNANNAWKAVAHLAKAVGLKVHARFTWSQDPKAAKPGQSAQLFT